MMTEWLQLLIGWIVSVSLKAGLLALMVALLLWIAGDRIPARWRYATWLIVFLKLAVPVAPESTLSVFNLFSIPTFESRTVDVAGLVVEGIEAAPLMPPPVDLTFARDDLAPIALMAGAVWLAGFMILAIRLLVSSARLHWRLRQESTAPVPAEARCLLEECKHVLGVRAAVRLAETELVATPALHGIVHPKLLLPSGFLGSFDHNELRFIFLHELAHLRRRDVIANWAIATLQIVHWFNPLVWLAAMRIREERELACDELALDCLQQDEHPRYGRTILKLLEVIRAPRPVPALLGILSDKQQMKRRLLMISRFRSQPRMTLFFLTLLIGLAAVTLTDARAGEPRRMFGPLGPAERATLDKLDARVSFQLAYATLSEVLAAITARTGVAITPVPEVRADAAQQRRITITADQVPAHAVLIETLATLGLGFEVTADGVSVTKTRGIKRMMLLEPGNGEKFERKVIRHRGPEGEELEDVIEIDTNGTPEEAAGVIEILEADHPAPDGAEEKIFVRKILPHAEEVSADGTIRRNLVLKMKENGVETVGKLQIEVRPN